MAVVDAACWYLDWSDPWPSYLDSPFVPLPEPSFPGFSDGLDQWGRAEDLNAELAEVAEASAAASGGAVVVDGGGRRALLPTPPWRREAATRKRPVGRRLEGVGGMLGGEAAIWTERIDWTNFECRLWSGTLAPLASAPMSC
jgi:hypothetical protein